MTQATLTEDTIRSFAPSVFAEAKHESRSDRYTYIPTIDIVRGLSREGFFPVKASESYTRDESRRGFAKHMLRFRRAVDIESIALHGTHSPEFPEVILVNSHDGSSAYKLMSGIFRLVCTNGMVRGNNTAEFKVRHSGNVIGQVIEAAYKIAGSFGDTMNVVEEMKTITLAPEESRILAESAAEVRFDLQPGEVSPVPIGRFLAQRRSEDYASDLWTTFNRIQENTIKGGLRGVTVNDEGQRRNMRTREVKGIDQNIALNRALFTLAEKMAALKK